MSSEMCPKCRGLQSMVESAVEKVESDNEGNKFKIVTRIYHCGTCNTFIRSEDIKENI